MEQYYLFLNDTKTTYAPKIISNEELFKYCNKCGCTFLPEIAREFTLLIEGKRKIPDIVHCGHYPLLIVSENVLKSWQDNKITGYKYYNVKLVNKENLEIKDVKKYYNIVITGRADLDFERMGLKIIDICSTCGKITFDKKSWDYGKAIIKEGTYDGTDLFVFNHFETASLCTEKNLKIVYKDKLTNFRFQKIEDMFDYMSDEDVDVKALFKK